MVVYPTEKITRMTAANMKPAGVPRPLPKPTEMGVLNNIAEIGAARGHGQEQHPKQPDRALAQLQEHPSAARCQALSAT